MSNKEFVGKYYMRKSRSGIRPDVVRVYEVVNINRGGI